MNIPFHEAASILPLMTGDNFDALVEDIRKYGLRQPITLLDGKILDGRNRYRACLDAGVEPKFKKVALHDGETPTPYVKSLNVIRRHQTPADLLALVPMITESAAREAKERSQKGGVAISPQGTGKTRDIVGKAMGMKGHKVDDINRVAKSGSPELKAALAAGELSVSKAGKIARLPVEQQPAAITEAKQPRKATKCTKTYRLSTKAIEVRRRVKEGQKLTEACAAIGMSKSDYNRAILVAESGRDDLIRAMDSGLLTVRVARNALLKPGKIDDVLADAQAKQTKQMFAVRSSTGKTAAQILMTTLEYAWSCLYSLKHEKRLNSRAVPADPEDRKSVLRHCESISRALAEITQWAKETCGDVH